MGTVYTRRVCHMRLSTLKCCSIPLGIFSISNVRFLVITLLMTFCTNNSFSVSLIMTGDTEADDDHGRNFASIMHFKFQVYSSYLIRSNYLFLSLTILFFLFQIYRTHLYKIYTYYLLYSLHKIPQYNILKLTKDPRFIFI